MHADLNHRIIIGRILEWFMVGATGNVKVLLIGAAALSFLAGAFHLYFAFLYFGGDDPLRPTFIGIGLVFIAGAVASLLNFKRDLAIKGGAVWTVLTILS